MGIPTVFKSTDTAAPNLSGSDGSIPDILEACLVTGYDSISPLGWTKEFESADTNTKVFRAPSGTRRYLRVQHDAASGGSYAQRISKWDAYEVMTDVDTGTGLWASGYLPASNVLSSAGRAWVLIGDEEGFWLWTNAESGNIQYSSTYTKLAWFGDLVPTDPGDSNVCVLHCSAAQAYTSSDANYLLWHTTLSSTTIERDYAGVAPAKLSGYGSPQVSVSYGQFNCQTSIPGNPSMALDTEEFRHRVWAVDATGYVRGRIPGANASSFVYTNRFSEAFDGTPDAADQVRLQFMSGTYRYSVIFIDVGQDWRA